MAEAKKRPCARPSVSRRESATRVSEETESDCEEEEFVKRWLEECVRKECERVSGG